MGQSGGFPSDGSESMCVCVCVITNLREEIVVRPKNTAERLAGFFMETNI